MIHETGQIAAVSRNGDVWVSCASRSQCQRCADGRGCGGAIMGRLLGDRQQRVRVRFNHDSPQVGDPVSLSLDETVLLRGAILAYVVPLAGLLIGALTGHLLGGELAALSGGLAGFIVAWGCARWLAHRFFQDLHPVADPL